MKNKKCLAGLAAFILILALSGCSAPGRKDSASGGTADMNSVSYGTDFQRNEEAEAAYDAPMKDDYNMALTGESRPQAPMEAPMPAAAPESGADEKAAKIIRTAQIDMQSDAFDDTAGKLRAAAEDAGGYVESAHLSADSWRRVFNITLRVPAERFEEVRKLAESYGKVLTSSQSAEDVTAQYFDIAERLETKLIEEERLLDMISRADKIDDLLALEQRLGEVRSQIERFQSQLTSIDRKAAFSTIYISLTEVTKEEFTAMSEDLGGRIKQAFIRSVNATVRFFQEFVIFLAGALIPLAVAGIVIFVCVKVLFRALNKQKNKETQKENEDNV